MTVASTTMRLVHHVILRHTSTGQPVVPVVARLVPATPYGWSVRVRSADIIVSVRDGVAAPTPRPDLRIQVSDPRVATRLSASEVDVALTAAELTHEFHPIDMSLVVRLFDRNGSPRTGRTLVARATGGSSPRPTIPLAEPEPGLYRSVPTRWTAVFHPFDLLVNNRLLRKLTIDFTTRETRVRLVDTT